ncbi:MAG: hypothetical protein ACLTSG_03980 [Lachnospiraceae bacterium]
MAVASLILIGCFTTATSLSGISLGGTSIIIVVGVAIETVRERRC